jgi:hypothetical protein
MVLDGTVVPAGDRNLDVMKNGGPADDHPLALLLRDLVLDEVTKFRG